MFSCASGRLVLSSMVLALAACGGGGGDGSQGDGGPDAPAEAKLSITAATGAAFVDATITVTDSTGAVVGSSGPVGADGVVSITLAPGAQAPLVITATRSDANGETTTLVSVVKGLSDDGSTTVNVTPVTTLVAALLSSSGDPAALAPADLTPDRIEEKVAAVRALLLPLLEAAGVADADPLTTPFDTDGSGYDRMLDSLVVQITPASATESNIVVGVKGGDDEEPNEVQFTSTTADAAPPLAPVNPETLVVAGTAQKIEALLRVIQACYALHVEQRVNTPISEAGLSVGTAADVTAPECKAMFAGNDPSGYKHNGTVVGRDSKNRGAWASLFRRGATGLKWSQGSYEYTTLSGDVVASAKWTDSEGNEDYTGFVLRQDPDGALRLIGNQYKYSGGVTSFHTLRQFINKPEFSYLATGYRVDVANQLDENGESIFNRVEVIRPNGKSWPTLVPTSTSDKLVMNPQSGSAALRIGYEFLDPAAAPGPNEYATFQAFDSRQLFANPRMNDEEIQALQTTGKFTFRYFLKDNAGSTPDEVQYYRVRSRPMTIAELRQRALAQLEAGVVDDLVGAGQGNNGFVPVTANTQYPFGPWTVPTGALPATTVTIYGRIGNSGTNGNDGVTVRSTARSATIPCTRATAADDHCAPGVGNTNFAGDFWLNALQLFAKDSAGREYTNIYALPIPSLP